MRGEAAKLTAEAMVRNLTIAERLGCMGAEGDRPGSSGGRTRGTGRLRSEVVGTV
jgi:hypothetical protein